ncbi:DUF3781 domain-containing protein [Latilactobacillus sakei]|nr:DUF3781 domain-containing protein [Latilactobacillus sakei]AWZ43456.1 DUF3781 domain-containing protein [Latilactobacillus sakei]AYG17281.1 DUF3781 domain-containing protein [Latilactobacillus sakei]AYG26377.1 DUF3781 domain-containing protein [Latilactobacillus sakei]AYG31301.1 DUF3781 domain-containing protein [Latilactobacillus sakei]
MLKHICYTPLVYERINKKLAARLTHQQIEALLIKTIETASQIERRGKNFYVVNSEQQIQVTVNANNYRVITVDRLK